MEALDTFRQKRKDFAISDVSVKISVSGQVPATETTRIARERCPIVSGLPASGVPRCSREEEIAHPRVRRRGYQGWVGRLTAGQQRPSIVDVGSSSRRST